MSGCHKQLSPMEIFMKKNKQKDNLNPSTARRILNLTARLTGCVILLWFVIIGVYSFESIKKPELKIYHCYDFENEFHHNGNGEEPGNLKAYLAMEDRLFKELESSIVVPETRRLKGQRFKRYISGSLSNPSSLPVNFNRTQIYKPENPTGGILLLHGLTDSPYSMRTIASLFNDRGYYTISLRLPGHGTAPSGLFGVEIDDWMAVIRMAMKEIEETIGQEKPLYMAGYSNGGALSILYSMETLEDERLRRPDKVFLISPAIGVTPFAMLLKHLKLLSHIPFFKKAGWLSVISEYDPFKYNSFPLNAGYQSHLLSKQIQKRMKRLEKTSKISDLPDFITYLSLVDATISTPAAIQFYNRLIPGNHELVLFDINRNAYLRPLMKNVPDKLLSSIKNTPLPYHLTLVTNHNNTTRKIALKMKPRGERSFTIEILLEDEWPAPVYSLSHVAIPFPVSDPVYGLFPQEDIGNIISIGRIEMRGEINFTIVGEGIMRLRCNPFFDVLSDHMTKLIEASEQ